MRFGCNSRLLAIDAPAKTLDHGLIRKHPKHHEKSLLMVLIRNGKFFQLPERSDDDFKTLFGRVAAAGVGRPVDKDGCPQGPWTADLLADAISQIEANRAGIELRTVQLWFENNDKGISAHNIRWLARVLGCNDPEGASAWQAALSASQSRLTARRRESRRAQVGEPERPEEIEQEPKASGAPQNAQLPKRFGLASATEGVFAGGSLLNLPASVFAGAVALQLVSYFLSVHDVTYLRGDEVTKQVGFLWAPNWTFLFIVFLPLFLVLVVDLVAVWKGVYRADLLADIGEDAQPVGWLTRVESSSYVYWAVFVICVGFAGVVQWISVRLLPLLNGGGTYAADWGSRTVMDSGQDGVIPLIAFTAAAYLYMCLCFYLLVSGLILLCHLIDDFIAVRTVVVSRQGSGRMHELDATASVITKGVVRCTIAGLLVAMCMKLQSLYIVNSAPNILVWLILDAGALLGRSGATVTWDEARTPTNYTSLIVVMLVSVVYLYGMVRIGAKTRFSSSLKRATAVIAFLLIVYFSMGLFDGFSFLLAIALLVSLYGLFDPYFELRRHERRGRGCVL